MRKVPIYQIDAFTDRVFSGNPAAVCPLDTWLEDSLMQAIAQENNLSETAFLVSEKTGYHIRWFTPAAEVDLCGHGTLATAFVLFESLEVPGDRILFNSRSGRLAVEKDGDLLAMDFPSQPPVPCNVPDILKDTFHKAPSEILCSEDYFVVFPDEEDIKTLKPDMEKLAQLDLRGVIVTAEGKETDFVSRFFAPKLGIPEDPVTGSAHCTLIPYWSDRLDKKDLYARQLSGRGGEIFCKDRGERVVIAGRAVKYMEGTIIV
jgi:PhzF family phenazine biosynthesis protein